MKPAPQWNAIATTFQLKNFGLPSKLLMPNVWLARGIACFGVGRTLHPANVLHAGSGGGPMVTTVSIAQIGALLGDQARVAMLQALMDGRALTASELAQVAGVTRQTASGHLAQLASASLVTMARQGRHRYHRLASPRAAQLLESLMLAASEAELKPRTGPQDVRLRLARTCYDHLAGWVSVSIADAIVARGWVEVADDAALVTPKGLQGLAALGLDLDLAAGVASGRRARPLCRPCLDWRRAQAASGWPPRCVALQALPARGMDAKTVRFASPRRDADRLARSSRALRYPTTACLS